jgi:ubiquinone/menaquinone biosynthesis C-methylase UbiE
MKSSDALFAGSIPEVYERCLGPLLFRPYAIDLANRAQELGGARIVEIAAGTGIATRVLASVLPSAQIDATDLNEAMVRIGAALTDAPNVRWSAADAMALPFASATFDLAVCQFGVMFFPNCLLAMHEIRRVLTPCGAFAFNVWDDLDGNDVPRIIWRTAADAFPDDPPSFLPRVPYGHGQPETLEAQLNSAGFSEIAWELVEKPSGAVPARDAAAGFFQGTPMYHEIVERDASRLNDIIQTATRRLREAFRSDTVGGRMRAFVFTARAPK